MGRREWAPVFLNLIWLIPAPGCYLVHSLGSDSDSGGGVPFDASTGVDTGPFDSGVAAMDAPSSIDAGRDAGWDAGRDAGWDTGVLDASVPIEPPPPPPGRCRIEPETHPFRDPVMEYRWPSGSVIHSDSIHVCSTPLVIDLEPEDEAIEPQIVFVSYPPLRSREEPPGVLRIVDPKTDSTVSYPASEGDLGVLEATGNLAAGDLDGDGTNEIVGLGVWSGTYAFRSDGTLLWESAYPTAIDRGLRESRSIGGGPSLADLEGDGTVEVVIGHNVLEGATGRHRFTGGVDTGRGVNQFLGPLGCVADLDGDGMQEVISGHTAFRANGDVYWDNPEALDGLCAVADTDPTRPGPEVVLVSAGYVRVLDGRSGEVVWIRNLEGRIRISIGGAPTVADFDGDGDIEFGVAHGGAYGVYDPSCTGRLPDGCTDEGLLWLDSGTADSSSSGTGSSVFDFNGDGRAEVVYNDQLHFRVYDGATGTALFEHRNSSRTRSENPTIADVDNDGDAEIIFSSNAEAFFIRPEQRTDPGIEVWGGARGRWVGARRIWNQHSYHITNVEEDGTVTSPETDSWEVLNAYRQNLREGGDVLAVPDLWAGHGTYECTGRGRARLQIEVQNWGLERVGSGIVVGLYRGAPPEGTRVGEAHTVTTLEPRGGSETVTFDVSLGASTESWHARLDDPEGGPVGGTVAECREDNNVALVWRPSCP